jgi:hypothetical protein
LITNVPASATISVWPSGAALATAEAPRICAPPPRFSMMICWPQASESFWPSARATTSVTPPAAAVTTMVIVLVG